MLRVLAILLTIAPAAFAEETPERFPVWGDSDARAAFFERQAADRLAALEAEARIAEAEARAAEAEARLAEIEAEEAETTRRAVIPVRTYTRAERCRLVPVGTGGRQLRLSPRRTVKRSQQPAFAVRREDIVVCRSGPVRPIVTPQSGATLRVQIGEAGTRGRLVVRQPGVGLGVTFR
ncbi:MAG: hypothetical protein AAFV96_02770 [Pseudomonadota bacterium]